MTLILEVVLILCMALWLFAALSFPAAAPFSWGHPLLAWICVAIIIYFIFGEGGGPRRVGLLPAILGWMA